MGQLILLSSHVTVRRGVEQEGYTDQSHPSPMCLTHVECGAGFVRELRGQGAVNCAPRARRDRPQSCVNISLKPSPQPGIRSSQTSEKSGTSREEDCHVSWENECAPDHMTNKS